MYDGFKKLQHSDRSLYETYLNRTMGDIPSSLYFMELMAWDYYNCNYYRVMDGYLCILVEYHKNGKLLFLPPLGEYCETTYRKVVLQLAEYAKEHGHPLIFLDASEQMKTHILSVTDLQWEVYDRENYRDYYYSYPDFMGMFQKPSIRYAYRYFVRKCNPVLHPITNQNVDGCMTLTRNCFCDIHQCEECTYGCELVVMASVMHDYEQLGVKGILVEVDGQIIGYCMAQTYRQDLVFHFKKSRHSVRGLNEYLHYHMVMQFPDRSHIQCVNYSDDMGIPGLRKYKQGLAPYCLKPRYFIQIAKSKEEGVQK